MTVEIDGANNIIKTNTINEVSSANGVTVDGLSIKDSKLVTANSVIQTNITDQAINEAKMQISNSPVNGYMLTAQSSNTGGLTWASPPVGGTNTPQFLARSSSQSISSTSHTAVINPSEMYDSDSLYNTSDGKFTVTASTTGYYFMIGGVGFSQSSGSRMQASFYKNGSITHGFKTESYASSSYPGLIVSGLFNLSSNGDYVQLYCYQNTGSSKNLSGETEKNFFGGFKLITWVT